MYVLVWHDLGRLSSNRSDLIDIAFELVLRNSTTSHLQVSTATSGSMSGVGQDITTRLALHYDILLLIFEQLKEDLTTSDDLTKSITAPETRLTHVATVCKLFFEPAMDIKWRELGSLFPLLKVIPNSSKKGNLYVSAPVRANCRLSTERASDGPWPAFRPNSRALSHVCEKGQSVGG